MRILCRPATLFLGSLLLLGASPGDLESLDRQAQLYSAQGRFAEAEPLYQRSLASVFALRDFSPRTSPPVRPSFAARETRISLPVQSRRLALALVHSSSTTRLPFG